MFAVFVFSIIQDTVAISIITSKQGSSQTDNTQISTGYVDQFWCSGDLNSIYSVYVVKYFLILGHFLMPVVLVCHLEALTYMIHIHQHFFIPVVLTKGLFDQ